MIKKLLIVLLSTISLTTSLNVNAGELINGATIVEVTNTNNNGADFAVILTGGTGPCVSPSRTIIVFPESKKQSDESYRQAFSIALAGLANGMKVRVHNFEDNSCTGANFISLSK